MGGVSITNSFSESSDNVAANHILLKPILLTIQNDDTKCWQPTWRAGQLGTDCVKSQPCVADDINRRL